MGMLLPGSPGLGLSTACAVRVLSFRAASSDHLHDLSGAGVPAAVFSSYAPAAESSVQPLQSAHLLLRSISTGSLSLKKAMDWVQPPGALLATWSLRPPLQTCHRHVCLTLRSLMKAIC